MKTGLLSLKSTLFTFLFLVFFSFSPICSQAQLMGKYEFTGVTTYETPNNFTEVTAQPYYATFSPFKRAVVEWWRGDNVFNSREWGKLVTEERYIEFTITAKPDYALNLTSLSFDNYRTETGPTNIRITHNGNGNFNSVTHEFLPAVSDLTKTTWNFDQITVQPGGAVTFRIYGYGASSYLGAFRVDNVSLFGYAIPQVKVNEFHYANTAVTRTGFIEVAVPKDFSSLSSVQIALYNGEGNVYGTYPLSNFKATDLGIDPAEKLYYLDIPAGLADERGGFCLYAGKNVIQFLSYGGEIAAISGPAAGLKSQDVNISEKANDGPDNSVYLAVKGNANYAPGTWGKGFDNTNTKGFPNVDNSVLPVELVYFRAHPNLKEVNLSWATATEKNNDKFVVEKSYQELSNFKAVATVKGNGTSKTENKYQFTDKNPLPGISYYRLKQVDSDGTFTYSSIQAVDVKETGSPVSVYPNPTTDQLNIYLGNKTKELQLQVVNTLGKIVYQKSTIDQNAISFAVPVASLPAGTYYLVLFKDGVKESLAFVKQ